MREKGFVILPVVILIIILGVAAFLFVSSDSGKILTGKISPTPMPTPVVSAVPTPNNEVKVNETDLPNSWKLFVNKNIPSSTYSISHPKDWLLTVSSYNMPGYPLGEDISDTLILEQDGKVIKIYRAPTGPGGCYYADKPNTDNYPGWTYTDYQEFKISGQKVRRSKVPDSIYEETSFNKTRAYFNICGGNSGKDFGTFVVDFGNITYETPRNINQNELSEMDSILQTLQKVK